MNPASLTRSLQLREEATRLHKRALRARLRAALVLMQAEDVLLHVHVCRHLAQSPPARPRLVALPGCGSPA